MKDKNEEQKYIESLVTLGKKIALEASQDKELEKRIAYDLEKHKEPRFSVNDLADVRKLIKNRESKQS